MSCGRAALVLATLGTLAALWAPAWAQAHQSHCTLRHRIPGKARREIMRKFEAERHAGAGGIRGRKAWIRCGSEVIALAPIVPPPKGKGHCRKIDNTCLAYQDDSVWRRYGKGDWELLGGFLACEEFPPSERRRFFDAGLCAKLGRALRFDRRPARLPGQADSPGPVSIFVSSRTSSRPCGSVAIDYTPVPGEHYSRMYIKAPWSIRCARARAVMRRYHDDHGPCSGSSCYRSYADGWGCSSVTPGQWPVIQECLRGRLRVLGYVKSKIKGPRRHLQAAVRGRRGGALRLSPTGLGPLRFGMDAEAAERALGNAISVEDGINGCSFWTLPGVGAGGQLIARQGRLSYILLFERGTATTRGIRVGDGLGRLRHRYRGKLHRGRTASLGYAQERLFVTRHEHGAAYEIEFDIVHGRVAFISAATKHVIETFGECA
jgi:hypothetical protein